jgi:hypothetical protein
MKIIPTETIGFHLSVVTLFACAYACHVDRIGWYVTTGFAILALVCYWVVLVVFRRTGRLVRWWRAQVTGRSRARFSVGIVVSFLNTLHILLFFAGMLLVIAHLVFAFERTAGMSWSNAFSSTFEAASIKGFSAFIPTTLITRVLLAVASLLGLVLTALWVTIFMRAFDAVFKFRD